MKASTGAGKGDTPRPTNKKVYDANYERIFGRECSICKGKGYLWENHGGLTKMYKEPCAYCKGTGKVFGPV